MPQRPKKLLDQVRACSAPVLSQDSASTMPTAPRRPTSTGPSALSSVAINGIRWTRVRRNSAHFSVSWSSRETKPTQCPRNLGRPPGASFMMSPVGSNPRPAHGDGYSVDDCPRAFFIVPRFASLVPESAQRFSTASHPAARLKVSTLPALSVSPRPELGPKARSNATCPPGGYRDRTPYGTG